MAFGTTEKEILEEDLGLDNTASWSDLIPCSYYTQSSSNFVWNDSLNGKEKIF